MQSLERTKRVIIALHGWTGNINSLNQLLNYGNSPQLNGFIFKVLTKKIQWDTPGSEKIIGMVGNTKNRFKN